MDEERLQISGIQHFAYCPRQWALIHLEQQWKENERTVDGQIFHGRAHDEAAREMRGNVLILRGMRVFSERLGVSGTCDVVEFHRSPTGITLAQTEGTWRPYPIEYKRGEPKQNDADRLQLCAQAMCLEEMLVCHIAEGALYYGETRRREVVVFNEALREEVQHMLREMQRYYRSGYTPAPKQRKGCNACSLREICLPRLEKLSDVSSYIHARLEDNV